MWRRDSSSTSRRIQSVVEHSKKVKVVADVLLKCGKKLSDATLGEEPSTRDSQKLLDGVTARGVFN